MKVGILAPSPCFCSSLHTSSFIFASKHKIGWFRDLLLLTIDHPCHSRLMHRLRARKTTKILRLTNMSNAAYTSRQAANSPVSLLSTPLPPNPSNFAHRHSHNTIHISHQHSREPATHRAEWYSKECSCRHFNHPSSHHSHRIFRFVVC